MVNAVTANPHYDHPPVQVSSWWDDEDSKTLEANERSAANAAAKDGFQGGWRLFKTDLLGDRVL